ncbi:RHS repeat-associated core domain-containing protein [Streptomyces sp. NPDC047829]|uniref:RHS repeat-associated core domain-containing protein n=1 Tax=Streptomyces sp. NPDC047829 TaxID=3154609 RepID=UPI0033FF4E9D
MYCWDDAGNLTSRDGSKSTCPGSTTYTYNDASELTGKNGTTTGWSYDKLGNETSTADTNPRTGETWTDHSQLAGLTTGGKTYDLVHAGTSNAERTKLGDTWFHHTALGLASTTTNGVDTGFIREPSGTLNSMTTGGKSYYYLTDATGNVLGLADDAGKRTHTYSYGPTGLPRGTTTEAVPQPYRYAGAYADPTGLYKMGHRYYDPTLGRFTHPTPPARRRTPTFTRSETRSTEPTQPACSASQTFWTPVVKIFGVVSGCVSGIGAAASTGTIQYAAAVGGVVGAGVGSAVGAGAAVVGSCALGGAAGYYGADIITYG